MYYPSSSQNDHLSTQAGAIGTGSSSAPASTTVANISPTGSAIYNLENQLMGNNANYQGMLTNQQNGYLSTSANLTRSMASSIQSSGSKKSGKGK